MDEFEQLGYAKHFPHELFQTISPPKAVGFAIFYDAAHMIGWDARSMLLMGRMQTALLACGMLAMVYGTARAIGESRLRAGVILLVLLSFSNFIERIFETRAEPLATFFAVAALLVAVRGGGHLREGEDLRVSCVFAAGALAGLAFLSTQKSLYFDVALGLALVGDAAIGGRFGQAVARGAWLVLGWLVPVVLYCILFGRGDWLAVGRNLFFGPIGVTSPRVAQEYGGLSQYLVQTLVRNSLLYLLCFGGMALGLLQIERIDGPRRVALIFSLVITALVFAHNQPWPYVFVMALPFVALWPLGLFEALAGRRGYTVALQVVMAVAVAGSLVRSVQVFRTDNHRQLALVERAEALMGPREIYFDGIGMIPNRPEPSTLWLDHHAILETVAEGRNSEAYRIFAGSPPKLIIWSYRMDAIEPLVGALIRNSYVQIGPNIRIAGIRLRSGERARFNVPVAGRYALFDLTGKPLTGRLFVNGAPSPLPVQLPREMADLQLKTSADALLLPDGTYEGKVEAGRDDPDLFADVYG